MKAPRKVLCVLNQPEPFDFVAIKVFEECMLSTLPGEDDWKDESARQLWNPIFNAAVESTDKTERE